MTEKNEGLGDREGCKARQQRMGTLDEGEPREKPVFEWLLLVLVLPGPFPLRYCLPGGAPKGISPSSGLLARSCSTSASQALPHPRPGEYSSQSFIAHT